MKMLFKLKYNIPNHKTILILNCRQHTKVKRIKYTQTVNLPKTEFPNRLNYIKRKEIEQGIIEGPLKNLYEYQRLTNRGEEFILHDGPPYANGEVHIGHAVNKVLKDIIIKMNITNQRLVHYKPGWDCHGLPIELKATTLGIQKQTLQIRNECREFAAAAVITQKKEFESWGITANWENENNTYKTFNANYIMNQLNLFLNLYENNLIYRELKPVYWSPTAKTALAEAELEYDANHKSPSIYLRLKLSRVPKDLENFRNKDSNIYAIVWTTTPWTLPTNQAVCFNNKINYSFVRLNDDSENLYIIATDLISNFQEVTKRNVSQISEIIGRMLKTTTYLHPLDKKVELPFLASNHVDLHKGTGLVHSAPAHGLEDYLVSIENNIPIKCVVDENGCYTSDAPSFLRSKNVLDEGNFLVLNHVQNDILFSDDIVHSYPVDWRTKEPVIIRASEQWFFNTGILKNIAIEKIDEVNFYPKKTSVSSKKQLCNQVLKRPYWCISRQRVWGVPIPVFYEKKTKNILTNRKIINHLCLLIRKYGNIDFWWSNEISKLLPENFLSERGLKSEEIEKGHDIFDIWFDSGISWSFVLENSKIADLYLEGQDQFTGWFQASLLTSLATRNKIPYRSIFVHGFAVDEKGYKMSKSLGNVIYPREIIDKYGIDVMRWWIASHATQHSLIEVSHKLLEGAAESVYKIRGTLKYLNGSICLKQNDVNIETIYCSLSCLDKFMLHKLFLFEKNVDALYASYDFNRVTALIQNFVVNDLSATYLHLIKDRLYCGFDDDIHSVQSVLTQCYQILCKTLWPIVPFLIEESWSYYDNEPFYKSEIKSSEKWENKHMENVINHALNMRYLLFKQLKEVNSWTLDVIIKCDPSIAQILKDLHSKFDEKICSTELSEILQVSSVKIIPSQVAEINFEQIKNPLCPRCRRFRLHDNDITCTRCKIILKEKFSK